MNTSCNVTQTIQFLSAVHGDEGFSKAILERLRQSYCFEWTVGNEQALKQHVRFTEKDLNRVAPGDPHSDVYEARRASEIIKRSRGSRVIDIHGTTANSGIFVIVTNPKPENIALAASLPIERIVVWAAKSSEKQGPLTQFMECAVEIECGPKDSPAVHDELETILRRFLESKRCPDSSPLCQNWFRVYGKLGKETRLPQKGLADFQETELNGEGFYPLLVGQYADAHCYKMQKLNWWDLLSY